MSSSQCNSTFASVKNLCTTKLKSDEVIYTWTIEDFDFHEARGKNLQSSTFSAITNDKYKWYLFLKPNGEDPAKSDVSIYLYWIFTKDLPSVFVKVYVDFLKQEQIAWSGAITMHEFNRAHDNQGWRRVPKAKILLDNKLTIRCRVIFSDVNNVPINLPPPLRYKTESPELNLSKSFASLFDNQEFSDVIISVKNKDYPAHKCILAARSPVFAAMFKHDTKENQFNRVNIEDIDEKVMDEMLRFIYTGKCKNLKSPLARGLLVAADKYALDDLKIICSSNLLESLSVENVADVLLLAEMHRVHVLKKAAINFIVNTPAEVFDTDGWEKVLSNPQLVGEVCRAVALR